MLSSSTDNDIFIRRYEACKAERANLDWQWDLVERYVVPGRGRFFLEGLDEEASIDWRHPELFDNVAVLACQNLAASLHSSITNPATRWFNLRFRDDKTNESKQASAWLEDCAHRAWLSLQDSNFNLCAGEMYIDAVGFGTSAMFHEEEPGDGTMFSGHRFRTPMLRETYFEDDWNGMPLVLYRVKAWTMGQLVDKFGEDALPEWLKQKLMGPASSDQSAKYEVVQVIYRRDDKRYADVTKELAQDQRPYGCRYITVIEKQTIKQNDGRDEETGYYEMPAYIPRWSKTAGSKYGHSPAINCMGDIRTLQKLVELVLRSAEKVIDPAILTTQRGVIGDMDLQAGGLTVVRRIDDVVPFESRARFDVSQMEVAELRRRIERGFYVDQLELKESPAMTATEVNTRVRLMQRLLGPSLTRLQTDFLDPLVRRTFWMMYRKGAFEELPAEVADARVELDVEYIGALPRSQRMEDIESIQHWVGMMGDIAQVKPEILDTINEVALSHTVADRLGVPADIWRDETEVDEMRAARAEQEQAQQALVQRGAEAEVQGIEAETAGKVQQLEAV